MSAAENTNNRIPMTPHALTRAIIASVALKHGTNFEEIVGQSRRRNVVIARCEAIRRVSAARPHWSYPELGRLFGRDHTSVMHHLDKTGQGKQTCRCDWHIQQYAGANNTNEGSSANG